LVGKENLAKVKMMFAQNKLKYRVKKLEKSGFSEYKNIETNSIKKI